MEASLRPNETVAVGAYEFTFRRVSAGQDPHRFVVTALVDITKDGERIGTAQPALNYYPSMREPVGTPAVQTVQGKDLYLSLLSFARDGSRVALCQQVTLDLRRAMQEGKTLCPGRKRAWG